MDALDWARVGSERVTIHVSNSIRGADDDCRAVV